MLMRYERELLTEYARLLASGGYCPGTSGNLSLLDKNATYMAITPSGMDYMSLEPLDIVITDLEYNIIDGNRKPSSEIALHTEFYRAKPEIRCVIHTHSMFCTVFSVLAMPIKAVHFAIGAAASSEVPCAPYVLFGTEELAKAAVSACGKANAVLLQNHGMVCCAKNIESAYSLVKTLEYTAELQYRAMSIGSPSFISDEEFEKVLIKLNNYGQ